MQARFYRPKSTLSLTNAVGAEWEQILESRLQESCGKHSHKCRRCYISRLILMVLEWNHIRVALSGVYLGINLSYILEGAPIFFGCLPIPISLWTLPVPCDYGVRRSRSDASKGDRFLVVSCGIEGLLEHWQHWRDCRHTQKKEKKEITHGAIRSWELIKSIRTES